MPYNRTRIAKTGGVCNKSTNYSTAPFWMRYMQYFEFREIKGNQGKISLNFFSVYKVNTLQYNVECWEVVTPTKYIQTKRKTYYLSWYSAFLNGRIRFTTDRAGSKSFLLVQRKGSIKKWWKKILTLPFKLLWWMICN